ncbi:uncharacterized protein HD556DRAFT_1309717 [Suillus plorans]|uniref:Uncharacterized protein n=1 Tax=Suillus plorans TaxID=116603 RepID=A0A9P7DGI6_9AGAM|nr:uncharacterized protein HD556DRAFT_1309717 [Suillus plorans]KAG1791921.1 hypothetical protein HD556DRAFT_1309717 [Suillus plorans]
MPISVMMECTALETMEGNVPDPPNPIMKSTKLLENSHQNQNPLSTPSLSGEVAPSLTFINGLHHSLVALRYCGRLFHDGQKLISKIHHKDFGDGYACATCVASSVPQHSSEFIQILQKDAPTAVRVVLLANDRPTVDTFMIEGKSYWLGFAREPTERLKDGDGPPTILIILPMSTEDGPALEIPLKIAPTLAFFFCSLETLAVLLILVVINSGELCKLIVCKELWVQHSTSIFNKYGGGVSAVLSFKRGGDVIGVIAVRSNMAGMNLSAALVIFVKTLNYVMTNTGRSKSICKDDPWKLDYK